MPGRANLLSQQFSRVHEDVIAFVEACSEGAWLAVVPGDGRALNSVVHHITACYPLHQEVIVAVLAGRPLPAPFGELIAGDEDALHRHNARDAEASRACTRDEALALLRSNGERACQFIATLGDVQLEHTDGGPPLRGMPVERLLDQLFLEHPRGHLADLRRRA